MLPGIFPGPTLYRSFPVVIRPSHFIMPQLALYSMPLSEISYIRIADGSST